MTKFATPTKLATATNFATAIRTADTLIEVGRFLYEARTASRRSVENHRSVGVAAAHEHLG